MEVLKINKDNQEEIIEKAKEMLEKGKVLVFPTDTVYGLIADAENKQAVEKIFKIKKRSKNKAVPVFVKNIEPARKIAEINKEQENILISAWPGKTTVVLERKGKIKIYRVDKKTIALRIPDYRLIYKLFSKEIEFIAQTSANVSGKPSLTKIKQVINTFKDQKIKPDLIIDKGDLPRSSSSKVIDITQKEIKILRK